MKPDDPNAIYRGVEKPGRLNMFCLARLHRLFLRREKIASSKIIFNFEGGGVDGLDDVARSVREVMADRDLMKLDDAVTHRMHDEMRDRATAPCCARCGQPAKHFIRPSLGESGFYLCELKPAPMTNDAAPSANDQ